MLRGWTFEPGSQEYENRKMSPNALFWLFDIVPLLPSGASLSVKAKRRGRPYPMLD
jgi:hypothetical protein